MAKRSGKSLGSGDIKALLKSKTTVDTGVMLVELIEKWGGPAALASDIHSTFLSGPPMAKTKIMQMVVSLITSATRDGMANTPDPAKLSDEDLDRTLREMFGRIESGELVSYEGPPGTEGTAPAADAAPAG